MPSMSAASRPAQAQVLPGPIAWVPRLSVGIDEIDGQHRVLVEVANRLRDAVAQHRGRREALALLEQLVDYTRVHFAIEEALMRVHGYPDYEAHRRGHERLMEQIYTLRHRAVAGHRGLDGELVTDLQRWVLGHIGEADPDYSAFFIQRGLLARYPDPDWNAALWGG